VPAYAAAMRAAWDADPARRPAARDLHHALQAIRAAAAAAP
jgi:hypothetical protein